MDRKSQLSNVAFGGDWSENIVPREELARSLSILSAAVEGCGETDLRTATVLAALEATLIRAARGSMLRSAFMRAAGIPDPALRRVELVRCLRNIEAVVGVATNLHASRET